MLSMEEKAELLANLVTGKFRYELRELENAYEERNSLSFQEKQSFDRKKYQEFLFLSKYSMMPGFYNHVEKKVFGLPTYDNQRTFLIQSIVISIVHNGIIDLRGFDKKPVSENEEKFREYTRRNAQNLLRSYQGLFFQALEDSTTTIKDGRIHPFTTVHSVSDLPKSKFENEALISLINKEFLLGTNSNWVRIENEAKMIHLGNPIYLNGVYKFISVIDNCLKDIEISTDKEQDRINFLNKVICKMNPILTDLFFDCSSYVGLNWWNKRSPKQKDHLMERGFKYKVDSESVEKSIEIMKKLGFKEIPMVDALNTASVGCSIKGKFDYSVFYLKAIYDLPFLNELYNGLALECLGVVAGIMNNQKKSITYFKRSLNHYKNSGDVFKIAQGYFYLGQARLSSGNEDGMKDLQMIDEITVKLTSEQQFDLYYQIANLARTNKENDLEKKYLRYCRDLHKEVPNDKQDIVGEVCDRLLGGIKE